MTRRRSARSTEPYEPPTLTYLGNLRDLLPGGAAVALAVDTLREIAGGCSNPVHRANAALRGIAEMTAPKPADELAAARERRENPVDLETTAGAGVSLDVDLSPKPDRPRPRRT